MLTNEMSIGIAFKEIDAIGINYRKLWISENHI